MTRIYHSRRMICIRAALPFAAMLAMVDDSAGALVASDGELILTGELSAVLSTGGSNLMSIRIPRTSLPPASSLDFVLLSASNETLALATMSMVQGDWAVFFRSPSNSFTTFGGFPTTALDFSLIALGQPNLRFEAGVIVGDIQNAPALPPVTVFVGQQNIEYLMFTSGSEPRVVAQNLSFIPEPAGIALVALSTIILTWRRPARSPRNSMDQPTTAIP
jgi:hypothetical protein